MFNVSENLIRKANRVFVGYTTKDSIIVELTNRLENLENQLSVNDHRVSNFKLEIKTLEDIMVVKNNMLSSSDVQIGYLKESLKKQQKATIRYTIGGTLIGVAITVILVSIF